ncbi:trypsin-like peptidase domain-containing protein [Variovorax sp. YR752]|uniref:trypsin-like peptidase domain-containing protein n=1 Tax=Variovorax sp. YR752 TaxID=1884383 RepID=UPI0031380863
MSFEGYLPATQLREVIHALVDLGLFKPEAQDAMRSGITPAYQALLPVALAPKVQLTLTLNQLNRVHNLVNGDVPLAQFLEIAALLSAGTSQAAVIGRSLETVHYVAAPPSAPTLVATHAVTTPGPVAPINTEVTLQAQTGALDQTVSVRFLSDGLAASKSVVKLLVHRHIGGESEFVEGDQPRLVNGTGWIIAPGLLITNHHVINARRKEGVIEADATDADFRLQAENTRVLFDYVSDGAPEPVLTGPGALLYSDRDLDFALLRLPAGAPLRRPLRLRTHAMRKTQQQALGMGVNLLQHPNGKPMRLGFRNNYVVVGDDRWLSYLTDTDIGSSGSPVCDDTWRVSALHAGSRAIQAEGIEILGQRYRRENYGIPMPTIMTHLGVSAPALMAEITAGQAEP